MTDCHNMMKCKCCVWLLCCVSPVVLTDLIMYFYWYEKTKTNKLVNVTTKCSERHYIDHQVVTFTAKSIECHYSKVVSIVAAISSEHSLHLLIFYSV